MCEILGVCSSQSFQVNDLLNAFFHHSRVCKHGWGLAVFRGCGASLEKEPVMADDSLYLRRRLTGKVQGANLLAHIWQATIGRIEYVNCHPFLWEDAGGRAWTLVHNGTLFETTGFSRFLDMQEGTTDSEQLLLYIVEQMNMAIADSAEPLGAKQRFRILDDLIAEMSAGNKLNLLLYDGEIMYVHTNFRDSLYVLEQPGRVIFSTTPLLHDGWKKVPMNQLLAYRSGELLLCGKKHSHEFFEKDHDLTPLLATFAEL